MPAHRMPHQDRRTQSPLRDDGIQVSHVMTGAVAPLARPIAVAMAALVEGKHVMRAD